VIERIDRQSRKSQSLVCIYIHTHKGVRVTQASIRHHSESLVRVGDVSKTRRHPFVCAFGSNRVTDGLTD
jgi:hypothetical protein